MNNTRCDGARDVDFGAGQADAAADLIAMPLTLITRMICSCALSSSLQVSVQKKAIYKELIIQSSFVQQIKQFSKLMLLCDVWNFNIPFVPGKGIQFLT